ncbi:ATP-binding cassette domain-containing protein [Photobacterium sp. TY1-4]|uniref:ABC transporter ATP-binding protein n=1 Tax=Photobacterium sp. TY1-4 TaxID=2899122 RepID=UPI0021C1AF4A|nr:ATP-binding cassette domain-containing protein [Photobacterium sp. TY1-4]UXI03249.1 ATP-binding cassette domain-containing protein [Photobacterium sp. TY1-4]
MTDQRNVQYPQSQSLISPSAITLDTEPTVTPGALRLHELASGQESRRQPYLTRTLLPGQHLAVCGPSGCGKTSLLQVLAGLQPAANGHFSWQGRMVDVTALGWWRRQFCYLPQQPVMGAADIAGVLRLPWQLKAMTTDTPDDARCVAALVQVGLSHALDRGVEKLSGGEKQRLAFARALLMARPVWLLDEPTSALDPDSRDQVLDLLVSQSVTAVSVSHDPIWLRQAHVQHRMENDHE